MVTNNLNNNIKIRTTLWLCVEKNEIDRKCLVCKADWNVSGKYRITFLSLMKNSEVNVSYADLKETEYCRSTYEITPEKWFVTDHKDIKKILRENDCWD